MIKNMLRFNCLIRVLITVILLLNIITPKCYGNLDFADDESVNSVIECQGRIFNYTSLAILPMKILSGMMQASENQPLENKSNKDSKENSSKNAMASSEFSIVKLETQKKISRTEKLRSKLKISKQNVSSGNLALGRRNERFVRKRDRLLIHKLCRYIVTLPRAGIDNSIIIMSYNI